MHLWNAYIKWPQYIRRIATICYYRKIKKSFRLPNLMKWKFLDMSFLLPTQAKSEGVMNKEYLPNQYKWANISLCGRSLHSNIHVCACMLPFVCQTQNHTGMTRISLLINLLSIPLPSLGGMTCWVSCSSLGPSRDPTSH